MENDNTTKTEVSQDTVASTPEVVSDKQENTSGEQVLPARDENGRLLPGNTANPNGRPLGAKNFTTKVKEALEELGQIKLNGVEVSYQEALIKKILHKAVVEGDKDMIKLIWNYLDGMPVQQLQHQGGIVLTTLSPEERAKLEEILYGQPRPVTTKEPIVVESNAEPSVTESPAIKQGSNGAGNKWETGAEEISV